MTQNPTQTTQPPPQGTSFLDDIFARLRGSGYQRDTDSRWFGGVCSGLAQRFGVDPVLIRAAAVVLAFLGGLGLTVYVVLWLLLPDRRGDMLAERAVRQGDAGPIALLVLAALLVVGGVFSIGQGNGWFAPLWLIPVAVVAWLVVSRDRSRRDRAGARPSPAVLRPSPSRHPAAPAVVRRRRHVRTPMNPTPAAPGHRQLRRPSGRSVRRSVCRCAAPYGQSGPYGGSPAGPLRRTLRGARRPPAAAAIAPPPPPRPRRRRPSAFVGLLSLGLALVGIGLGAGLDDPMGFPGTSATLGFLIALDRRLARRPRPRHVRSGVGLQRLPRRRARPPARRPPRRPRGSTWTDGASATGPGVPRPRHDELRARRR